MITEPFETKTFNVHGRLCLTVPAEQQIKLAKAAEAVAKKQFPDLVETVYRPFVRAGDGRLHADYTIYRSLNPSDTLYRINFDFSESTKILSIKTAISGHRAAPIIAFLARNYFRVKLAPTSSGPVRPAITSRFRSQTLTRADGSWIRVGDDGVTFTCPTEGDAGIVERSYAMTSQAQLDFLDNLLDCFSDGRWHKPETTKAEWQNKLFKRGAAKQFLDDHIECWGLEEYGHENGGRRGTIRLQVPPGRTGRV